MAPVEKQLFLKQELLEKLRTQLYLKPALFEYTAPVIHLVSLQDGNGSDFASLSTSLSSLTEAVDSSEAGPVFKDIIEFLEDWQEAGKGFRIGDLKESVQKLYHLLYPTEGDTEALPGGSIWSVSKEWMALELGASISRICDALDDMAFSRSTMKELRTSIINFIEHDANGDFVTREVARISCDFHEDDYGVHQQEKLLVGLSEFEKLCRDRNPETQPLLNCLQSIRHQLNDTPLNEQLEQLVKSIYATLIKVMGRRDCIDLLSREASFSIPQSHQRSFVSFVDWLRNFNTSLQGVKTKKSLIFVLEKYVVILEDNPSLKNYKPTRFALEVVLQELIIERKERSSVLSQILNAINGA